jgi:hypothetical protein
LVCGTAQLLIGSPYSSWNRFDLGSAGEWWTRGSRYQGLWSERERLAGWCGGDDGGGIRESAAARLESVNRPWCRDEPFSTTAFSVGEVGY